jgi:hypothetical protein
MNPQQDNYTKAIFYSDDNGATWNVTALTNDGTNTLYANKITTSINYPASKIVEKDGVFYAMKKSNNVGGNICASTDLINWKDATSTGSVLSFNIIDDKYLISVGSSVYVYDLDQYPDLSVYTTLSIPNSNSYNSASYSNDGFTILVGNTVHRTQSAFTIKSYMYDETVKASGVKFAPQPFSNAPMAGSNGYLYPYLRIK